MRRKKEAQTHESLTTSNIVLFLQLFLNEIGQINDGAWVGHCRRADTCGNNARDLVFISFNNNWHTQKKKEINPHGEIDVVHKTIDSAEAFRNECNAIVVGLLVCIRWGRKCELSLSLCKS